MGQFLLHLLTKHTGAKSDEKAKYVCFISIHISAYTCAAYSQPLYPHLQTVSTMHKYYSMHSSSSLSSLSGFCMCIPNVFLI